MKLIDRNAAIGERIQIVNKPYWEGRYQDDAIFTVRQLKNDYAASGYVLVDDPTAPGELATVMRKEYRVIADPFIVGDIVTGTPESDDRYVVTTSDMVAEVVKFNDGELVIKVIQHATQPNMIGQSFYVNPKYFKLSQLRSSAAPAKPADDFQVGDYVRVTEGWKLGTCGTIVRIDGSGIPYRIEDEDGVKFWKATGRIEKCDKPATPEFNVGDHVRGTSDEYGYTNKNMKRGEVVFIQGATVGAKILELDQDMKPFNMETVFPIDLADVEKIDKPQPEAVPQHKFKVGDRVKGIHSGRIYVITKQIVRPSGLLAHEHEGGGGWVSEHNVEAAPVVAKFAVGDKVKVVGNNSGSMHGIRHYWNEGTVCTVQSMESTYSGRDEGECYLVGKDEHDTQTIHADDLELCTEPSQELKVGDAVKSVGGNFQDSFGIIEEVGYVGFKVVFKQKPGGWWKRPATVQKVDPIPGMEKLDVMDQITLLELHAEIAE